MRLLCRLSFVGTLVAAIACYDGTSPSTLPAYRYFVLESVDQRAIPTIISAGAGDTTQVLWSTVTLDSAGRAVTINHLSHVYLQYPSEESTLVWQQAYRMKGDSIEIGSFKPCPGTVMCAGNLHGKLVDSTLTIAESYNPYPTNPIIYTYHLVQAY